MARVDRNEELRRRRAPAAPPGIRPRTAVIGVSLALGALLFGVAIRYGMGILRTSTLRSNVLALSNGGQQIAAAQGLYRADRGSAAAGIGDLVPEYMRDGPAAPASLPGTWTMPSGDLATVTLGPATSPEVAELCAEAARQSGFPDAIPGTLSGGGVSGMLGGFGCARDGQGDGMVFAYRLN